MFSATGLLADTQYCFRVRAGNSHGESPWSPPACNSTLRASAPGSPEAPSLASYHCEASGQCALEMAEGALLEGGGAALNRTECWSQLCTRGKSTQGLQCEDSFSAPSAQATCTVERAERFALIEFRTRAINAVGTGNWSLPLSCAVFVAHGPLCTRPSLPTLSAVRIDAIGSDSVALSWQTSSAGGGAFEIQRDDWWYGTPLATVDTVQGTRAVLKDLLPSTKYHIRVRPLTAAGEGARSGEWSETIVTTTKDAGVCGDSQNLPAQKQHFDSLKKTIQFCLITAANNADKAAQCINDKIGFTKPCAMCWIANGRCAASKCLTSGCLTDPEGKSCEDCSIQKCFPALIECTGLPLFTDPR